ncbi:site-specific recombinase XerD [Edaphobacter aggregans]|uniref:Site-specific recombinase XerD n=1 Tax=Edaphobacter aggregans TaxID=570835 RepID=A0A428MFC4_9BACT|nr:site-specific integrase [Edaphobacter aggregans]RSL15576.1 site-specific recombinase XerD [Edaphobacter aggregans]
MTAMTHPTHPAPRKKRTGKAVAGVYEKNEGSGIWYVRYRLHGHLVRKRIGRREDAVAYLEKVRYIRSSGNGSVPETAKQTARTKDEVEAEIAGVTVSHLCDLLLNHIQKNPKKYKDQENPPRRLGQIKKEFGSRIASGVKAHEISDWLENIDRAPATRNRLKTTFSGVYRHGIRKGKVSVNPARDVASEPVGEGVIRALSEKEEARLRKVLQADVDACGPTKTTLKERAQHHIYELDIALGAGLRRGEQYSLPWPDVEFEEKKIMVRNTKTNTDRVVYMNEDVFKAFRGLKSLSLHRKRRVAGKPNNSAPDLVFAIADNKKWFASALRRARIKNFRWHDLRHSFCTRLAENGANAFVIMKAAGHKSAQTSARYIHLNEKTMRLAMEGLRQLEK